MSSSNNLETTAKIKLAELSAKLDFVIKEVIEDMSSQEIGFVLENYSKFLTYDLKEILKKNVKKT